MSERGLGRRSWIWARGVPLLCGGLTLAGLVAASALTAGQSAEVRLPTLLGVLVVGACLYLAVRSTAGMSAVQRRVSAVRQRWALTHGWSFRSDGAAAPPGSTAMALPRGWRPPRVVAALSGHVGDREAYVQTWLLRSVPTSKRRPSCREVVVLAARTGDHRCAVLSGVQLDPLLITPAWARPGKDDLDAATGTLAVGDHAATEAWVPAIRAAVAARADLPLTVAVGQDQVILFAMDDPRTTTMRTRLELAARVAEIVDPSDGRPAASPGPQR